VIGNFLKYTCDKNVITDKATAKIKLCSFFASHDTLSSTDGTGSVSCLLGLQRLMLLTLSYKPNCNQPSIGHVFTMPASVSF